MSEALEVIGCLAAAGALSTSFLASDARLRAAGLVLAGALATALVAGQGWDDIRNLREHHLEFAGAILAGILVLAIGAAAMLRWPILLPLLVVAALPFRIRLHVAGGQAVNLLVPLYVVIGTGVLATVVATVRGQTRLRQLPKPLVLALVLVICLYAVQTIYSEDVAFAARNVGFFLVPFAILFSLLAEATWDRRLLKWAFVLVLAEGLVLAAIGIGQYADQHIFWNGKLDASNDFHFYFRVNSLFWDPNIYGRYLVLAVLLGTTGAGLGRQPAARARPRRRGGGRLRRPRLRLLADQLHRPLHRPGGARRAALERPLGRHRDAARPRRDRGRSPLRCRRLARIHAHGHRGAQQPGFGRREARPSQTALRLWLRVVLQGLRERRAGGAGRHDDLAHRACHRCG